MMVDDNDDFGESFVEFLRHTDEQTGDDIPGLPTPDVGSEWSGAEIQQVEDGNFSLGSFSVVGENPIQQEDSSLQVSASSSSHFDIDKHVRLALQSQSVQVPKQVWESGVWSAIFSDDSFTDSFNLFGTCSSCGAYSSRQRCGDLKQESQAY